MRRVAQQIEVIARFVQRRWLTKNALADRQHLIAAKHQITRAFIRNLARLHLGESISDVAGSRVFDLQRRPYGLFIDSRRINIES